MLISTLKLGRFLNICATMSLSACAALANPLQVLANHRLLLLDGVVCEAGVQADAAFLVFIGRQHVVDNGAEHMVGIALLDRTALQRVLRRHAEQGRALAPLGLDVVEVRDEVVALVPVALDRVRIHARCSGVTIKHHLQAGPPVDGSCCCCCPSAAP